jgi:hypothetical protein
MRFSALPLVFFLVGLGLSQDEASLGNILQATTTLASSSPQVVATIQIQIDGLLGSGVISLNNAPTISNSQGLDGFSSFTPTLMSDGPQQTDSFPNLCDTTSLLNTTTIPPRFANSTLNFNATAGPSAPRPFATPTPTALSIFTSSGVLTKRGFPDISALLSAVVIQIAVVFFI